LVSLNSFENLTNWQVVQEMNPALTPTLLQIGTEVIFPLFCKCPSKTHIENGIKNLITYVWQPNDNVLQVSATFNASPAAIVAENGYGKNFSSAVGVPVLIPVSHLPTLSQISHPHNPRHHRMFFLVVVVSLGAAVLVLLLIAL
jgi:hypothetical protein